MSINDPLKLHEILNPIKEGEEEQKPSPIVISSDREIGESTMSLKEALQILVKCAKELEERDMEQRKENNEVAIKTGD